jgi:hypothetical protein
VSYYVKGYELELLSREVLAEKVRKYAVEGSDVEAMLDVMDSMRDRFELFEVAGIGAPNVVVPRKEPVRMGGFSTNTEPEPVMVYLFEWGPRGDTEKTVYMADDNQQAREIGQHVVEALTRLNGEKPENPRITPGGPIPEV